MKLHWLRQNGFEQGKHYPINEENNPMYQLNLNLGFVPQPAWLDFSR